MTQTSASASISLKLLKEASINRLLCELWFKELYEEFEWCFCNAPAGYSTSLAVFRREPLNSGYRRFFALRGRSATQTMHSISQTPNSGSTGRFLPLLKTPLSLQEALETPLVFTVRS